MWVMTDNWFVSAVQHREQPDVIIVRARRRKHLEVLLRRHCLSDRGVVVEETPAADYPFRARLQREEWARVLLVEATLLAYPNYKAAACRRGFDDAPATQALHNVWRALQALEQVRPRGYERARNVHDDGDGRLLPPTNRPHSDRRHDRQPGRPGRVRGAGR